MTRERAIRQRLTTQRLASAPLPAAADAVRLLTCVQSQERAHACFSLGIRARGATLRSVHAEIDALEIIRTHILRPTWHFVAPEDLRWILALTSPRVISGMAARHRQLGLHDARLMRRAYGTLEELLRDRTHLTRAQIGQEFQRRGRLPLPGEQLGHLLMLAELEGRICSGPIHGVNHTYALVDEVLPPAAAPDRAEAHARLAHRFFAGHGPATVKDFTRWSSLTVAGTNAALAALGDALERVEIDGVAHWFDPTALARRSPKAPGAYLLPTYDEAVLTYPAVNFPALDDHPYADHPDPFWAWVVADERNVGLWKRTVNGDRVAVDVRLAQSAGNRERAAVGDAARRLADFLELPLEYDEGQDRPRLWGGEAGHPARRPRRADRA